MTAQDRIAFGGTQAEAATDGIGNLRFKPRDLSSASSVGRFDLVPAFDAVRDQKDPKGRAAPDLPRAQRARRSGHPRLARSGDDLAAARPTARRTTP